MYFAIFFAIFVLALVSWLEVLYLLEYGGILPKSNDPYAAPPRCRRGFTGRKVRSRYSRTCTRY